VKKLGDIYKRKAREYISKNTHAAHTHIPKEAQEMYRLYYSTTAQKD